MLLLKTRVQSQDIALIHNGIFRNQISPFCKLLPPPHTHTVITWRQQKRFSCSSQAVAMLQKAAEHGVLVKLKEKIVTAIREFAATKRQAYSAMQLWLQARRITGRLRWKELRRSPGRGSLKSAVLWTIQEGKVFPCSSVCTPRQSSGHFCMVLLLEGCIQGCNLM